MKYVSLKILNVQIPIVWLAIICAIGSYLFVYAGTSAVPGRTPGAPLGWWGWYDQSQYLNAAKNFITGNIAPAQQTYPPLYPLLGAALLPITQDHSFLIPNMLFLGAYVWLLFRLFQIHLGALWTCVALLLSLWTYPILFLQWIVPWTSTLAAPLELLAFWLFSRFLTLRFDPTWTARSRTLNAVGFALAIGLLGPTRPVDLLAFMPLLLIYGLLVIKDGLSAQLVVGQAWLRIVGLSALAAIAPIVAYLSFNQLVFGRFFGGYFALVQNAGGETFQDLPMRAYSHVVNASPYFAEPSADWQSQIPIMAICASFLPVALFFGPTLVRVLAGTAILHLCLVYSYADAVPTGQFRYYNIHYFKWLYPILPAIVLIYMRGFLFGEILSRRRSLIAIACGTVLTLLTMAISPTYRVSVPTDQVTSEPEILRLAFASDQAFDFVDIGGISLPFGHFKQSVQRVELDDWPALLPVSEVRLTPIPGGMRLLFTDRQTFETAKLTLSGFGDLTGRDLIVRAGSVEFSLESPFRQKKILSSLPAAVPKNGTVYAVGGVGDAEVFMRSGWSHLETWGSWMDGDEAVLEFGSPDWFSEDVRLTLEGQGFISYSHQPRVTVSVVLNGTEIGQLVLEDHIPKSFEVTLPAQFLHVGHDNRLRLIAHQTRSPAGIGSSSDKRQLSFGLKSITFEQEKNTNASKY